jgi:hypothetical protein
MGNLDINDPPGSFFYIRSELNWLRIRSKCELLWTGNYSSHFKIAGNFLTDSVTTISTESEASYANEGHWIRNSCEFMVRKNVFIQECPAVPRFTHFRFARFCIWRYKVVQIWPGLILLYLHTNQSRSYLNHLVHTLRWSPLLVGSSHIRGLFVSQNRRIKEPEIR